MFAFDSSAIIEIIKDNKQVIEKYKDAPVITINLVYGEVYYYCLKTNLDKAVLERVNFEILAYTKEDIEEAMELLYRRKKETKDFSFVDAMIYVTAKNNELVLVTKDYGFKGLAGVEFIEAR